MMRRCASKDEGEHLAIHAVTTMSLTYFVLDPDFEWLLLTPAAAWLLGLVSYRAGRRAEHAIVAVPQINVDAPK